MSKNPVIDLVKEISGQANTLTIPRVLITLTGDIISALVLSQIIYWSTRTNDEAGWFYKSDAEFSDELGVSPKQLRRVREALSDFGVESERRGMPARMHYRIDIAVLTEKLVATFGNNRAESDTQSGQKVNTSCDQRAEHVSNKRSQQHNKETEITTEITTEIKNTSNFDESKPDNPKEEQKQVSADASVGSRQREHVDYQEFVDIYNEHCSTLPTVSALNNERRRKIKSLVKEHGHYQALSLLADATKQVASDPFWRERRYNLDNLLRNKVLEKAEKWRARQKSRRSATAGRPARNAPPGETGEYRDKLEQYTRLGL